MTLIDWGSMRKSESIWLNKLRLTIQAVVPYWIDWRIILRRVNQISPKSLCGKSKDSQYFKASVAVLPPGSDAFLYGVQTNTDHCRDRREGWDNIMMSLNQCWLKRGERGRVNRQTQNVGNLTEVFWIDLIWSLSTMTQCWNKLNRLENHFEAS